MRKLFSRRGSRRGLGQATVEFALVAILFFLLMLGIVDFGRAIWEYNTLSNATREGARFASVLRLQPNGTVAAAQCSDVATAMNSLGIGLGWTTSDLSFPNGRISVVYGSYDDANPPTAPTLNTGGTGGVCTRNAPFDATPFTRTPDFVVVGGQTVQNTPANNPYYVAVSATAQFQAITPLISNIIGNGGVITLRSSSIMVTSF